MYGIYRCSAHQITALLPEIILYWLPHMQAKIDELGIEKYVTGSSVHHLMRTYTHNLKTAGHIRTLFRTNDYCTIADIYFVH